MEDYSLGSILTELRTGKGIRQEEVADALLVSNKTISKWENGDTSPDIVKLAELAKYYRVSTDYLLGLKKETQDASDTVAEALKGLDIRETALRLFEIIRSAFSPCLNNASADSGNTSGDTSVIPPDQGKYPRYSITLSELFSFLVCSENVNFAVVELRNKANFGWLLNENCQDRIKDLLTFLADKDAMNVLYTIHSDDCSDNFTADYIAKRSSLDKEKTVTVLEKCCSLGICSSQTAHLRDGQITVYESYGDGLIISLLSIAYERMCGNNAYDINFSRNSKMIRGEVK